MAKSPFNIHQAVQIINNGLKRAPFTFAIPQINATDISIGSGYLSVITDNSPYDIIFGRLARNRIKDNIQFTHFKSLNRTLDIILKKEIQVSNLTSNQYNDYAEYSEFLRRAEFYHSLIPKDYCDQVEKKVLNVGSRSLSDDVRDNTFIFCFSQDYSNPRFWTDYAKDETGVAIVFRFISFNQTQFDKYDLRDVHYDSGYDFEFINYINFHLRKEFGYAFIPGSVSKFARFYKRQSYQWEVETRLCFNIDTTLPHNIGLAAGHFFQINNDLDPNSDRKYLNIPLLGNATPNPLFSLTIDEVVVGKNVKSSDFNAISDALNSNFPNATITQRI
jgi:hypothetical protein